MNSKVLIVDDDPTILELLLALLSMEGFDASALAAHITLTEMVEQIKKNQPDLILCDVNLNHIDGLDLLRSIRKQPELKHIRILMSSGMDFSQQSLEKDADGFILKPYMPDDLVTLIKNMLSTTHD